MKKRSFLGISPSGFHRIAYTEWGAENAKQTIICLHGLTRNSRDFDFLARKLSKTARIICPDLPGRGHSDWFKDRKNYNFPQYIADMTTLIARLNVESVDWIGTSLGALVGMAIASLPNNPIRKLVMNDVGPHVPKISVLRIAKYVLKRSKFKTLEDLGKHLREIYAPFGTLTDAQWRHVVKYGHMRLDNRKYIQNFDPAIIKNVKDARQANLWAQWKKVTCPVYVIRGENSDILEKKTLEKMQKVHPIADVAEIANTGHAPALMAADQIDIVTKWMLQ